MSQELSVRFRLYAFFGVFLLVGLIWLYVRELRVFSNTIGVRTLVAGSVVIMAIIVGGMLYALRRRFFPWERHWVEVVAMVIPTLLFAPLLGSLLNRAGGGTENQSFTFMSEEPYVATAYGMLMTGKVKVSGYYLFVKDGDQARRFQYKSQRYFPLTRPGEPVLLPVKKGLLGFRVVMLR